MTIEIRRLSAPEFCLLAPALVDIYIEAMGYPAHIKKQRVDVWKREVIQPGFCAVAAFDEHLCCGVAYGVLGNRDRWWDKQLVNALRTRPGGLRSSDQAILKNYFEIAEIHVDPSYQHRGIGSALLTTLLHLASARYALLSTPEVTNEANGAFGLYRKYGFFDLARNYHYPGDHRPFALLGKKLPL